MGCLVSYEGLRGRTTFDAKMAEQASQICDVLSYQNCLKEHPNWCKNGIFNTPCKSGLSLAIVSCLFGREQKVFIATVRRFSWHYFLNWEFRQHCLHVRNSLRRTRAILKPRINRPFSPPSGPKFAHILVSNHHSDEVRQSSRVKRGKSPLEMVKIQCVKVRHK